MKRPTLRGRSEDTESSMDDQMTELIADALSSNDRVVEIRPAKQSGGMGLKGLLVLGAGAVGLAYWVRNSQKSDDLIESAKEKTFSRTGQAAEAIEEGSETASEQIETRSERAGEAVQEVGEAVQQVGEGAAERTEEAGEEAAETADDTDDFSGT